MNMVERLHIDELKRVEKQTNALLKLFRRLQKDYANLQEKYARLENIHKQSVESYITQIDSNKVEHSHALAALEEQWKQRYEEEMAMMQEDMRAKATEHKMALEAQASEFRANLEKVNAELKREKTLNAAMIARIRGVDA